MSMSSKLEISSPLLSSLLRSLDESRPSMPVVMTRSSDDEDEDAEMDC